MIKRYLKHIRVCRNVNIKPFNFVEYVMEKIKEMDIEAYD